jgi:zeta-carotene desaturase
MSEFYMAVAQLAERQGVAISLRCSVERIERSGAGQWSTIASDGLTYKAPALLMALPFEQTAKLLGTLTEPTSLHRTVIENAGQFVHAPITTIHLWFDREVTDLDHAALLDTRIQWMFNKTRIRREGSPKQKSQGQYLELVISASFEEMRKEREEILGSSIEELAGFFPAVRSAQVVKSAVLKEARATFSVVPGLEPFRPAQNIFEDGLFLAGDWTKTGWPSTMEGGVRSGRLAAESIMSAAGERQSFIKGDLVSTGLMRMLAR